ncbi:hypothetical protein [Vibrio injensis]|uniref:hypothetical protein n=1 Tax=Vibrio injensis TaxID=1307414 RepID=UPI00278C009F|nr:hypothetical protein [Vibrio injensis]
MKEQDIYLESIRERDTDLLLIEELNVEPAFQQFIAQSLLPQYNISSFIGAWHSVYTHNGESDVIAIFKSIDGKKVAVLIENKITTGAQPEQAVRYSLRGEEGIENGSWEAFITCLFAPQDYLHTDKQNYQTTLSYEAVQQFFTDQKTVRADYKSYVLNAAIEHQRRSKQRDVNQQSTLFAHKYINYIQSQHPELSIKEEFQDRALGHSWFYFYPFSDQSVYLVHQCANGNVGLTIKDKRLVDKKQQIEAVLSQHNFKDVRLRIGKQSISLLLQSPKINHTEGNFEGWINDIESSVQRLIIMKNAYLNLLKREFLVME